MSNEYEFFSKDYIKLYFLDETVNRKTAVFKLFLESDGVEKDFLDVRTAGKNVYRFNNFNVSEDAANNCITFRPNVVGCYVYFEIFSEYPVKAEIIKNGTNTAAESFELGANRSKIEFHPNGIKKYDLKVLYEKRGTAQSDVSSKGENELTAGFHKTIGSDETETEKTELDASYRETADQRKKLISHLDRLQEEYDKNYSDFKEEAEEISSKYHIDAKILKLYADKEVAPIEDLIKKAEEAVNQMEEQIRVFVRAQEKKTAEIESELKIGKKD